jgi:hypothetical protein
MGPWSPRRLARRAGNCCRLPVGSAGRLVSVHRRATTRRSGSPPTSSSVTDAGRSGPFLPGLLRVGGSARRPAPGYLIAGVSSEPARRVAKRSSDPHRLSSRVAAVLTLVVSAPSGVLAMGARALRCRSAVLTAVRRSRWIGRTRSAKVGGSARRPASLRPCTRAAHGPGVKAAEWRSPSLRANWGGGDSVRWTATSGPRPRGRDWSLVGSAGLSGVSSPRCWSGGMGTSARVAVSPVRGERG